MKFIRTLGFLLVASTCVFGAESAIEVRGVMVGGGATKLSLIDKATDTTRWVEVGQTFAGFTVKAYDAEKETATLAKDGKEIRLHLNSSQILEAANEATPAAASTTEKIPLETARMIFNNLRQICAASHQYYLEHGGSTTTLDEIVGPTKYIKQLKSEAGEDYAALKLSAGNEVFSVVTASGETITYDDGDRASTFYTVKPGDTVAKIAQKSGSSVGRIVELNQIDPTRLRLGQSLRTK